MLRYLFPPVAATLIALALFWVMQYLIQPSGHRETHKVRQVVELTPPAPTKKPQPTREGGSASASASSPPPPPPSAPRVKGLSTASVAAPKAALNASLPDVSAPMQLTGANGLGSNFGGFAGGQQNGSGGGHGKGSGYGAGNSGEELVPVSTARPQIPRYACKRHIRGWVKVVFKVNIDGRTEHIRVIDSHPRGLFEAAAVKYISAWRYEPPDHPIRDVTQRIKMNPRDCQYNWTD